MTHASQAYDGARKSRKSAAAALLVFLSSCSATTTPSVLESALPEVPEDIASAVVTGQEHAPEATSSASMPSASQQVADSAGTSPAPPGDSAPQTASAGLADAVLRPSAVSAGRFSIFSAGATTGAAQPGSRGMYSTAAMKTPGVAAPVEAGTDSAALAYTSPGSLVTKAFIGADQVPEIMSGQFYAADDLEPETDQAPVVTPAALSGLTRTAPNGLITQSPRVEVGCFKPELLALIRGAEQHFGARAIITSGHRDEAYNRSVGGAPKSKHISCDAADLQLVGVDKYELARYFRALPERGGVGTYCSMNSIHVDTGRKRDWNWRCRNDG